MRKIKIGKDIHVRFAVEIDGQPEDFSQATDISLILKNEALPAATIEIGNFEFDRNIVSFLVRGEDQKHIGKYRLLLHYKKPSQRRNPPFEPYPVDAALFELVKFSVQESGGVECPDAAAETVNIRGNFSFGKNQPLLNQRIYMQKGAAAPGEDYVLFDGQTVVSQKNYPGLLGIEWEQGGETGRTTNLGDPYTDVYVRGK